MIAAMDPRLRGDDGRGKVIQDFKLRQHLTLWFLATSGIARRARLATGRNPVANDRAGAPNGA